MRFQYRQGLQVIQFLVLTVEQFLLMEEYFDRIHAELEWNSNRILFKSMNWISTRTPCVIWIVGFDESWIEFIYFYVRFNFFECWVTGFNLCCTQFTYRINNVDVFGDDKSKCRIIPRGFLRASNFISSKASSIARTLQINWIRFCKRWSSLHSGTGKLFNCSILANCFFLSSFFDIWIWWRMWFERLRQISHLQMDCNPVVRNRIYQDIS